MNPITQARAAAQRTADYYPVTHEDSYTHIGAATEDNHRAQLLADTIDDLRRAVIRGHYVDYHNGSPLALVSEEIDSDADGNDALVNLRTQAWGATINGNTGALFAYYARRALVHYAETLVDLMNDGMRITFGAKV